MSVMTEPYNLSQLTTASSIYDLASFTQVVTQNFFFGALSIVMFLILNFLFLKNAGFQAASLPKSLIASGFIMFILSIFLVYSDLVSSYLMFMYAGITVFGLLFVSITGET